MAKTINKVARYTFSVNQPQNELLKEMMKADAYTDVSEYLVHLMINEKQRRNEIVFTTDKS